MSQRPTLAFVGTGMMSQLAHLANYAQLRDAGECEIAGITDLKPRLAEAVAARYRVPNVYATLDELLADSTFSRTPSIFATICLAKNFSQGLPSFTATGRSIRPRAAAQRWSRYAVRPAQLMSGANGLR